MIEEFVLEAQAWTRAIESHPGFHIAGICERSRALHMAGQLRPEIIVCSMVLPDSDAATLIKGIISLLPEAGILVKAPVVGTEHARLLIQKGVSAIVTKSSSFNEFVNALNAVSLGEKYICGEVRTSITEASFFEDSKKNGLEALTAKEIEVIQQLKKGLSSKEIAESLKLSVKTVEVHRYHILKKLELKNSAAVVAFFRENML